jgi:NADH-quinone oxidoreductase subunit L
VLAVLSVVGGWVAAPALWGGKDHFTAFLAPAFGAREGANPIDEIAAHSLELTLALVAVITALVGIAVAYWLYVRQPKKPEQLAKSLEPVYRTMLNKYWVDELYAATVVRPLVWISDHVLWKIVDVEAIDGTVNGIAQGASAVGDRVRHAQSGNARSYASWVVVGALIVIAILFWPTIRPMIGMVSK